MSKMHEPTVISLGITLPAAPKGAKSSAKLAALAPPTTAQILPSGPAYNGHARRALSQLSFTEDDQLQLEHYLANGGKASDEEDDADKGLGEEKEDRSLLESDPKAWKLQDHYAVLGLQDLRFKATDEQIKKAHRRKVLRHHPDKKASAGGEANDDSFFKCIAKAMEVLSVPEKRRQFDSVDKGVDDDDVPDPADTTAENFYELWGPVLEREGRFSKAQPIPVIGDPTTERRTIEKFYDFFYSIDSWRSFEYDDKDVAEGADSRDERRHNEKKNKSERAKKKSSDIARVRTLVDQALALDPRIKKFKADEKAARDAKKNGGGVKVDLAKKAEEEKIAKEAAEKAAQAEKVQAADDKTTREAAKKLKLAAAKNVKKDRKAISALVSASNYFVAAGGSPSPSVVEGQLSELDLLFTLLEPEETGEMKAAMEKEKDVQKIKAVIVGWVQKVASRGGEGKFKEFSA